MKKFAIYTLFAILFISSTKTLEFLSDEVPVLKFEFLATCGNSYITYSKISGDIVNEVRKNGITKIELELNNLSSGRKNQHSDNHDFNIYLTDKNSSKKVLLASSNHVSDKFQPILANYPTKLLYNNANFHTEEDKKIRSEFVSTMINLIKRN
jgi:hypothetical protein